MSVQQVRNQMYSFGGEEVAAEKAFMLLSHVHTPHSEDHK